MPTRVLTSYARDRSGYAVCIVQIGVFLFRADVGGVQRLRVCDAAGCNARRMYLLQADQDNFFFFSFVHIRKQDQKDILRHASSVTS